MRKIYRCASLTLALIILLGCVSIAPASALSFDCDVEQYSDTLLMVNLDTGREVFAKEADTKRYPAALTKVMTYVVAAEYYDDFNTEITIKQSCIDRVINSGMSCSGVDCFIGDKLTVTDLLYALMLPIGHDAAMVLADDIGEGDIQVFVDEMNETAERLGCTNTHFTNPFGVHDDDHYTTARDLYKITRYAMSLPMFSKICNTSEYYPKEDVNIPFITTNYMLLNGDYYYRYATGVKNGTTQEAGRCLIATAVYDEGGCSYMCICLHAPYDENSEENEQYCMIEAANMFRWAFLNLSFVTPKTKDTPVCEVKVDHAWDTKSILLVPKSDFSAILPMDYSEGDIRIVPDNTDAVSAPIKKGDVITTATVYYQDEPFATIDLVASEDVGLSPLLYIIDAIRGVLTSPWFLISVGLIVVLFIIYVSVSSSYTKKRRRDKQPKSIK